MRDSLIGGTWLVAFAACIAVSTLLYGYAYQGSASIVDAMLTWQFGAGLVLGGLSFLPRLLAMRQLQVTRTVLGEELSRVATFGLVVVVFGGQSFTMWCGTALILIGVVLVLWPTREVRHEG